MAGELFDFACLKIWPTRKGEGEAKDWTQKKYDALKSFAIPMSQYAKWISNIWECKMSLSGYYNFDEAGCSECPRKEFTRHTRTIFRFMEHPTGTYSETTHRTNKCPVLEFPEKGDGYNYKEAKCPDFNSYPNRYGKIPEEDLNKIRYNVCFGNSAKGWHKTWYRREDTGEGGYCPCPGTTDPKPPPGWPSSNSEAPSWKTTTCGECECSDGDGGTYKVGFKCIFGGYTIFFRGTASLAMAGGYYNTETRQVHPLVNISGEFPGVGWVHDGDVLPDAENTGPQNKHKTQTKMIIDGKSMPIGTFGNSTRGVAGNFVFSTTWTLTDRPL